MPQAPVHTDACTDYRDKLVTIHTDSDEEGHQIRKKITYPAGVVEQRISHFVMALAIIGTMTGPLLVVLHTIPRALFAGVFFIVGLGGILGSNILSSLVFLMSERRFLNPSDPRLALSRSRIVMFVGLQITAVAATVAISQTIGAIGFPVLITSLIPLRWVLMPKWFTTEELAVLDALTADNPVVLASLGGMPKLPETDKKDVGGSRRGNVEREKLQRLESMKNESGDSNTGKSRSEGDSSASPADAAVGDESRGAEEQLDTQEVEKEKKRHGEESASRQRVGKIER